MLAGRARGPSRTRLARPVRRRRGTGAIRPRRRPTRELPCCCPGAAARFAIIVGVNIPPAENQLLVNLLIASGRDPGSFHASIQPDGLVRVTGPRGTAYYPRDTWFTRFSRHLDKSFFDPEVPAPAGPRLERKGAASASA